MNNEVKILYFNGNKLLDEIYYNEEVMDSCIEEQSNIYCEVIEKCIGEWDDGIDHETHECIDKEKNWEFHQKFKNEISNMRKLMIKKTLLTFTKRVIKLKSYVGCNLKDILNISYYISNSLFPLYDNEELYDIDDLNNDLDSKNQNESGYHDYMSFILPEGTSYYPEYCENISIIEFTLKNNNKIILYNEDIITDNNVNDQKCFAQYNNNNKQITLID